MCQEQKKTERKDLSDFNKRQMMMARQVGGSLPSTQREPVTGRSGPTRAYYATARD